MSGRSATPKAWVGKSFLLGNHYVPMRQVAAGEDGKVLQVMRPTTIEPCQAQYFDKGLPSATRKSKSQQPRVLGEWQEGAPQSRVGRPSNVTRLHRFQLKLMPRSCLLHQDIGHTHLSPAPVGSRLDCQIWRLTILETHKALLPHSLDNLLPFLMNFSLALESVLFMVLCLDFG
jgi:hypothetical protein